MKKEQEEVAEEEAVVVVVVEGSATGSCIGVSGSGRDSHIKIIAVKDPSLAVIAAR